jgi:hypothetical protein
MRQYSISQFDLLATQATKEAIMQIGRVPEVDAY